MSESSFLVLFAIVFQLLLFSSFLSTLPVSAVSIDPKCRAWNIENPAPPPIARVSGIPVPEYGYINGTYIGPQLNPLTISTTAIDHYGVYEKSGNKTARDIFFNNSNWLVENTVSYGNYSLLEYHFPWLYDLKPPWRSGMTQAFAMQALIRGHQETGEEKYLDTARMLLNSFFVEVKDGGITYKTPNNGWWFEEYAGSGAKESRVLNGMTFALIGLYEYYKYTNESKAKYLFDQGVIATKKALPLYEYEGNYSNYDIFGTTNPLGYHKAHIETLCQLYDITKEKIFNEYYQKWKNFKKPFFLQ
jgi:heparosan-N-sulfate-glucuronate 5-epimerase